MSNIKTLRVAFSGAQSTGKSTVITDVMETQGGLIHIPSPARKVASIGLGINEHGTDLTQYSIFAQHVRNYHTSKYGIFMFDRCVLDSMAFTVYGRSQDKVSEECLVNCGQITDSIIRNYDVIFLCRPFGEIIADGIRNQDLDFQKTIDNIMLETAEDFGAKIISLEGPREERRDKVIEIINKLNQQ